MPVRQQRRGKGGGDGGGDDEGVPKGQEGADKGRNRKVAGLAGSGDHHDLESET